MSPPEDPLETAVRLLAGRDRTEHEVASHLAAAGHPPAAIAPVLAELRSRGWLDDARLARELAARSGAGRERVLADLERRGVPRATAAAAWSDLVDEGAIAPHERLRREVERRVRGPLDRRGAARVYNALLRAGFDPEAIRAALEPHLPETSTDDP